MLLQNKEKFDYLNITKWHELGYKGKGIRIAIIDTNFKVAETHLRDKIQCVNGWGKHTYGGTTKDHGLCVADIVYQIVPEAEIYFMSSMPENLQWCIDNNIDIITMSLGWMNVQKEFDRLSEEALKKGIYLVTSAGNEGEQGLTLPASNLPWIAVGACSLFKGKPIRTSYSSTGDDLEFMSLTNMFITNFGGKKRYFAGTSGAAPVFASMLALYFSRTKRRLPPQTLRKVLYKFCEDLETMGRDINTGHGLFILPRITK